MSPGDRLRAEIAALRAQLERLDALADDLDAAPSQPVRFVVPPAKPPKPIGIAAAAKLSGMSATSLRRIARRYAPLRIGWQLETGPFRFDPIKLRRYMSGELPEPPSGAFGANGAFGAAETIPIEPDERQHEVDQRGPNRP